MALPQEFWTDLSRLRSWPGGAHLLAQEQALAIALLEYYTASFTFNNVIKQQLNRMEGILNNVSKATDRLQADDAAEGAQLTAILAAIAAVAQANSDETARLEADIASLRNTAGSGDTDAINAVADNIEARLTAMKAANDQLTALAAAEQAVDTFTISPGTVTMARTATQQFSTNVPATFKAASGSVDSTGLYTPPTDTTITSDSVVATISDGTGKEATASVSITE